MPASQRWPSEIVTHIHKGQSFHCKVDFDPVNGKPHGFYLYRGDRSKDEDIDEVLDEISRKGSRVMQGRRP